MTARMWAEAPETLVVVELESARNGTVVKVSQGEFESDDMAAPSRAGWEGGLDKLVQPFERQTK